MSHTKKPDLFGGEDAEMHNALMWALQECAADHATDIYNWIEDVPKTTLVSSLVLKLKELGYQIKKL